MRDVIIAVSISLMVSIVLYVTFYMSMVKQYENDIRGFNNKIAYLKIDITNRDDLLINKNSTIVKQQKEIIELLANADELSALVPVSNLLTPNEIDDIVNGLPASSPFNSPTRITSRFGEGRGYQGSLRNGHLGNDLVPRGDWYIHPMWEGEVTDIGIDRWLGKYILIQHTPLIRTRYAHLQTIFYTALPGEHVTTETKIGIMGQTGHADGAHLHWAMEVFNGEQWISIDGFPWLKGHGNN